MKNVHNLTDRQLNNYRKKIKVTNDLKECWEWTGFKVYHGHSNPRGYGQWTATTNGKQKTFKCPKLMLEMWLERELYSGMKALHKCDNPPCCNPTHLYEGTPQDNSRDAIERNRLTGHRGKTPKIGTKEAYEAAYIWWRDLEGKPVWKLKKKNKNKKQNIFWEDTNPQPSEPWKRFFNPKHTIYKQIVL